MSNKKNKSNKSKNNIKSKKYIKRDSFYRDIDTLSEEQLKEEKRLHFIIKNIYGFVFLMIIIAFALPIYMDNIKQKDQEILEELGYEQMLIELRLINVLSNSNMEERDSMLNEIKEINKDMDKEYREISILTEKEKDYYAYFVGSVNSYLNILNEYYSNTNESNEDLLEEADSILYNFYEYKSNIIDKLNLPVLEGKEKVKSEIQEEINKLEKNKEIENKEGSESIVEEK